MDIAVVLTAVEVLFQAFWEILYIVDPVLGYVLVTPTLWMTSERFIFCYFLSPLILIFVLRCVCLHSRQVKPLFMF